MEGIMKKRKVFRLRYVLMIALGLFIAYNVSHALLTKETAAGSSQGETAATPSPTPVPTANEPEKKPDKSAHPDPTPTPEPTRKPDSTPVPTATPDPTPPPQATQAPQGGGSANMATPIYSVSTKNKLVALTFDDGPDLHWTPQVLEVLSKYNAKATFFLVGRQVDKYPDMVKRIVDEGHAVGNHTWSHAQLPKLTPEQAREQMTSTDEALKKALGKGTYLFRAPYGAVNDNVKAVAAQQGQLIIGWSIDTKDWAGNTPDQIMNNVKQHIHPGSIILQHSFGGKGGDLSNTVEATRRICEYLQAQGYQFVTVPELLAAK